MFTIFEPGIGVAGTNGRWHSTMFTWDGAVIVAGWEPGGGAEPECEATDPASDKSMFFYDATTGAKLGTWVLPRPQSAAENCTIHNYNLVPLRDGRDVVVSGNYQAGTWVTDITDPANPVTVGWSDPPPLPPVTPRVAASRSTSSGAHGPRIGTTTSSTSRRSPRACTSSGSVARRQAGPSACRT